MSTQPTSQWAESRLRRFRQTSLCRPRAKSVVFARCAGGKFGPGQVLTRPSPRPAAPVLIDCGRATRATRGSLFGPFYEGSAPPYTQRQSQ